MRLLEKIIAIAVVLFLIVAMFAYNLPFGRAFFSNWGHAVQKVDDATRYGTRKQVEDTCRSTIVSYESDKLVWEQYKDSENAEQRSWADAAKIRANRAAVTYNEYFLKNSYVFDGNVPADIRTKLELIQ